MLYCAFLSAFFQLFEPEIHADIAWHAPVAYKNAKPPFQDFRYCQKYHPVFLFHVLQDYPENVKMLRKSIT